MLRGCFPVLGFKAASLDLCLDARFAPHSQCLPASAVTRAPPCVLLGPTSPRPHGRSLLTCAIPGLPLVPWSQRPCRITPANLSLTSPHSSTLPLTPPQPLYLPLPHPPTHPPTYLPPAGTERRPGGRQRTTFRPGQRAAEEGQSGIKAAVDVHQKCDHHVRQAVEQASGYEPGGAPERFTSRVRSHG